MLVRSIIHNGQQRAVTGVFTRLLDAEALTLFIDRPLDLRDILIGAVPEPPLKFLVLHYGL
ncbi:hypothetical protein ES706_00756 [subsurface metagenome]|nr:hypothetical protein [Hadesarchaea archaeon]